MFCVIQKVANKKPNENGAHKQLFVDSMTWSVDNGPPKTKYGYKYGSERFERPILDAYKISIHKSYREERKVKKKQWVICTMSYYDLIDSWVGDHVVAKDLKVKLTEMGITEDQLWDMVCRRLDPIIEMVKMEFQCTEEYKTKVKHDAIITKYCKARDKFEKKYGSGSYDYCYDIFGELRNPEYLKQLEKQYKEQQEYQERSYRAYEESNYNSYQSSGYYGIKQSNYSDEDKIKLKKIFKVLSMKFHPDANKEEDGEMMKFINRLKEDWAI